VNLVKVSVAVMPRIVGSTLFWLVQSGAASWLQHPYVIQLKEKWILWKI